MQTTPARSSHRTAPLVLWRLAEAFLQVLHALFGAPRDLAARRTLPRRTRAFFASWLATGEALMRRLLIIEAAACPKPEAPRRCARKSTRARGRRAFDPDQPNTWRAGFRCFSSRAWKRAAACDHRKIASRFDLHSARPLAERYEALIRAFNDPGAISRRLARRLYAAPSKLCAILKAPPEARRRIDGFDALTGIAQTAARRFNSS